MRCLKQSTAQSALVGPFLGLDGITPVTSLTSSSTLNGRASGPSAGAAFVPATLTHDGNGLYYAALAVGDVPAAGGLCLSFSDPTTYAAVWNDFEVLAPAAYDAKYGATGDTPGTASMLASTSVLQLTGHVTSVTNTGSFAVAFAGSGYEGNTAGLIDGSMILSFTSGLNHIKARTITGGTLSSSTVAALVFAIPFGQAVQVNDTFAILSN